MLSDLNTWYTILMVGSDRYVFCCTAQNFRGLMLLTFRNVLSLSLFLCFMKKLSEFLTSKTELVC